MADAAKAIRAAAVQFRASWEDAGTNAGRIADWLGRLASDGVRVAAFPECALTAYHTEGIERATAGDLAEAEERIAAACREHGIAAVVGTPYFAGNVRYNGAVVWDATGTCIERYAKIQLVGEKAFQPGARMVVFPIDGVLCTAIICYDVNFPELVRIPVLAGARVVFYLSCETDWTAERSMDKYRAQPIVRAAENQVFVVCANTPMGAVFMQDGRPHGWGQDGNGRSRIIGPDGIVMAEAGVWNEEVVVADLDVSRASGGLARKSMESPVFREWWEAGLRLMGEAT